MKKDKVMKKENLTLYAQDWHKQLIAICEQNSQSTVATRLGIGSSRLNQILKKTYTGNVNSVKQRFIGEFMDATVDCPAVGDSLNRRACQTYQRKKPSASNPLSARFTVHCPDCKFNTSNR